MDKTKVYIIRKTLYLGNYRYFGSQETIIAVVFSRLEADYLAWRSGGEVLEMEVSSADLKSDDFKKFKKTKVKEIEERIEAAESCSKKDSENVKSLQERLSFYKGLQEN